MIRNGILIILACIAFAQPAHADTTQEGHVWCKSEMAMAEVVFYAMIKDTASLGIILSRGLCFQLPGGMNAEVLTVGSLVDGVVFVRVKAHSVHMDVWTDAAAIR